MTRIPNRFEFEPEMPVKRLPEPARLKWLKVGDAVVFCGHQYLDGSFCPKEIAKAQKPRPVAQLLPVGDGLFIPLRRGRWWLTGPRGESGFEILPDGVLRPRCGEPKLTKRPVPHEIAHNRIIRGPGRDAYGHETAGRAVTGYVATLGVGPVLVRCPNCGTNNEVSIQGLS